MKKEKLKFSIIVMILFVTLLSNANVTFAEGITSDVEMYQGIFMKGDIFLSIPMYTGEEDISNEMGPVYQVSRPTKTKDSFLHCDIIRTVGTVYHRSTRSAKNYYIEGDGIRANIVYKNGSISIHNIYGAEKYEGNYIQISNSGANMSPDMIWLNIPDNNDDLKVIFDGSEIDFDQPPTIIQDRVMVPFRAIFEAMGYTVKWDQGKKEASAHNKDNFCGIRLSPGYNVITRWNSVFTANEYKEYECDVAPITVSDRLLVPVRAIAELAYCDIEWDGDSRTVYITYQGVTL